MVARFKRKQNPVITKDGNKRVINHLYYISGDYVYLDDLYSRVGCPVQTGNLAIIHLLSLRVKR